MNPETLPVLHTLVTIMAILTLLVVVFSILAVLTFMAAIRDWGETKEDKTKDSDQDP